MTHFALNWEGPSREIWPYIIIIWNEFELPFHQISSCLNHSPHLWTDSLFQMYRSLSSCARCGGAFYGGCHARLRRSWGSDNPAIERKFPCVRPRFRRRPRNLRSLASFQHGAPSLPRPLSPPLTSLLVLLCPAWLKSSRSISGEKRPPKILHRRSPIRLLRPRRRLLWPLLTSSQPLRVAGGRNQAHTSLDNRRCRARLRPVGCLLRSSGLVLSVDNAGFLHLASPGLKWLRYVEFFWIVALCSVPAREAEVGRRRACEHSPW
jgi:hypothetical protein